MTSWQVYQLCRNNKKIESTGTASNKTKCMKCIKTSKWGGGSSFNAKSK